MSGQLSEKTKEKFIRTFERLVEFDKARMNLMFDDEPDVTSQVGEHRESLLSGQRGDFNFHLWLVQEMSRIKTRLNRNGWNGLTEHEQALVVEAARLAELDFPNFAKRSLAVAARYSNGVEYARQWLCFAMEHADDAAEKGQEEECEEVK